MDNSAHPMPKFCGNVGSSVQFMLLGGDLQEGCETRDLQQLV